MNFLDRDYAAPSGLQDKGGLASARTNKHRIVTGVRLEPHPECAESNHNIDVITSYESLKLAFDDEAA